MRYLFIDIECADGSRAICEFGYVLTDENFNIIQYKNLLVHPDAKFNLTGRASQDDLTLTYPYEEYYKQEKFPEYYERIRFLLTQKDVMIFGHSVGNDINFIIKDINRYNLDKFDFKCYDVQMMLPIFDRINATFTSLDNAAKELIDEETRNKIQKHRACDDALVTMLVFKEMVKRLEFTPEELIKCCPKCEIDAIEYHRITREKAKERHRRMATKGYRVKGRAIWQEECEKCASEAREGKTITISGETQEHFRKIGEIIKVVEEKKLVAIMSLKDANYFIVYNEEEKEQRIKAFRYPFEGEILTIDEFLNQ